MPCMRVVVALNWSYHIATIVLLSIKYKVKLFQLESISFTAGGLVSVTSILRYLVSSSKFAQVEEKVNKNERMILIAQRQI